MFSPFVYLISAPLLISLREMHRHIITGSNESILFIDLDAYGQHVPIYTPATNVCKHYRDYVKKQMQTEGQQVRCTEKSRPCSHPRPPASGEGRLFSSEGLYPLSLGPCSAEASRLCNEWALNGILPARFGHFSSSVQGLLNKPNPFLGSKLPKSKTLPLEIPGPLCCLCIELRDPLTSGVSLVFQVAKE